MRDKGDVDRDWKQDSPHSLTQAVGIWSSLAFTVNSFSFSFFLFFPKYSSNKKMDVLLTMDQDFTCELMIFVSYLHDIHG